MEEEEEKNLNLFTINLQENLDLGKFYRTNDLVSLVSFTKKLQGMGEVLQFKRGFKTVSTNYNMIKTKLKQIQSIYEELEIWLFDDINDLLLILVCDVVL